MSHAVMRTVVSELKTHTAALSLLKCQVASVVQKILKNGAKFRAKFEALHILSSIINKRSSSVRQGARY